MTSVKSRKSQISEKIKINLGVCKESRRFGLREEAASEVILVQRSRQYWNVKKEK